MECYHVSIRLIQKTKEYMLTCITGNIISVGNTALLTYVGPVPQDQGNSHNSKYTM